MAMMMVVVISMIEITPYKDLIVGDKSFLIRSVGNS